MLTSFMSRLLPKRGRAADVPQHPDRFRTPSLVFPHDGGTVQRERNGELPQRIGFGDRATRSKAPSQDCGRGRGVPFRARLKLFSRLGSLFCKAATRRCAEVGVY
jgi:hypothetical protein